jgi:hypothetical protein
MVSSLMASASKSPSEPCGPVVKLRPDEGPDVPPRESASIHKDGVMRRGSTGQLWRAIEGQWVRIRGKEPYSR